MEKLKDVRLKGSYLIYYINGNKKLFLLPQGLIQKHEDIEFFLDDDKLIAKLKNDECQVFPLKTLKMQTSKGVRLDIRLACTFMEKRDGKNLLLDHYMGFWTN